MANRLADEPSPYLRQHADNPVDWWPWGDEAFAVARDEDRPVLVSHALAREVDQPLDDLGRHQLRDVEKLQRVYSLPEQGLV